MIVTAPPLVLGRVTRTALLGVRFWDRVGGRQVADGLSLTEAVSGIAAIVNREGTFVFNDLPGMRASAFGAGDAAFWSSPPARSAVTFELADATRQFLPFTFGAEVPFRGLFTEDMGPAASPPTSPPDAALAALPLYSSPSRPVPGGMAVVRAELRDATAGGAPASAAVLEVSMAGGGTFRGFADASGQVAVLFSYPEPPVDVGRPVGPLRLQTWPLTIAVRYAPQSSPPLSSTWPPDVHATLTQPYAKLAGPGGAPALTQIAAQLTFGRELVLRTSPFQSALLLLPT